MKRYLLDLSELFTDHRQKAYIGYRAGWSTVGCVISTIRNTFNIESDILICSEDGIFYPACESVELICEDKTVKVLPTKHVQKESIVSDDEPLNPCDSNLKQESSTYQDIESVLLGLPKPKRHRVRKRKTKQVASEDSPSQPVPQKKERVQQTDTDTPQNGHIQYSYEKPESNDSIQSSDELELPYRNLNREMKARIVRAVSPSALNKQRCEPPTTTTTTNEATITSEPNKSTSKPNIKLRIIRAMPCTVEVKQEQLDASAKETNAEHDRETIQQSYEAQTAEVTNLIVIDSPTHVNGEEATHDTEAPAV